MDLIDYIEARKRGDRGVELSSAAIPEYGPRLYAAILAVAKRQEFLFVDDVTIIVPPDPDHPNASASQWRKAKSRGIIELTGRLMKSGRLSTNGHLYPQYRSRIFRSGK